MIEYYDIAGYGTVELHIEASKADQVSADEQPRSKKE